MPALSSVSNAKVLVTGANGYVAVWVVRKLLEQGYSVRGTVRSEQKGEHLKKVFKSYFQQGKLELPVVEDITAKGAFDDAVKGVDAVEHTASPFHMNADDPNELIEPAVKGTTGILESILAHGKSVQRVVITSSCAAIISSLPQPKVFTEEDWNDQSIEIVKNEGKNAPQSKKYQASKTLAEKAAWDFWHSHKQEINWDLVVLNPTLVLGPTLHEVASPEQLNTSVKQFYDTVVRLDASGKSAATLAASASSWIDVRDLALAHRLALEKQEAGGERIILAIEPFAWQDWLDVANSLSPPVARSLPKGNPGGGNKNHMVVYSNEKEKKLFGIKMHTREELVRDMLEDFEQRGW